MRIISLIGKKARWKLELKNTNQLSLFCLLLVPALSQDIDGDSSSGNNLQDDYGPITSPIIFVPGYGGSQLEAKLNKPLRVRYICDLVSDWYDLWLNIHLLTPPAFDCVCDNMRLTYNQTTHKTSNSPGVQIRPTKFGSIDSIDYLDLWKIWKTSYFDQIIVTLQTNNGYTRNVNMLGAPYDFRKAPNELDGFFVDLINLIQDTYINNNYQPVTLICHSMGCLNSVYLLNRQSESWKEVFIKRLISLAAPWDGSFKAISAMLFGDNLGIPILSTAKLQALQSTFPSLMYLFPHEPTFASDRVLVESPTKNFTLENFDDLFKEVNMTDQMMMWHDTREIAMSLKAPNVEVWCLYGNGSVTPSKIKYQGSLDSKNYIEEGGHGDGTVNLESLRACENWQNHQEKPIYTRQFDDIDHIDILRSAEVANFISYFIVAENFIANNTLTSKRVVSGTTSVGSVTGAGTGADARR